MRGFLTVCLLTASLSVEADEISVEEFFKSDAPVVILGEVHDNPLHHENQAEIVRNIRPKALVFEMFGPEAGALADALPREPMADLERALGWEDSGWPDFGMYHKVMLAAPEARIFGGGTDREIVRRAVAEGAAAPAGENARRLGLDGALGENEQAKREAGQMEAHCDALPPEMLPGMVEAQRLRDANLALAVTEALDQTGGPVAVITGNGHARIDWGIPRFLRRLAPGARVVSLGQIEAGTEPPDPPYDYWVVTEAHDRPDPCEAFR